MRVRPFSSEKKDWLLSPPSTVLLFRRPEIPRKLMSPKPPSTAVPGVDKAKLNQRRPLMGRLLMDVWLMLVAKSCCSVLTTGAELLMVTVSVVPATERDRSMGVTRPTSTTMLVRFEVARPLALISSSYTPGCKWIKVYRPLPSVWVVAEALVAILRAVIVAFGMTAPLGSVI